ncbi:MAG: hypothetical protein P8J32_07215 [bacterium]|nr:hypothetical protein [bacterium]
MSVKKTKKQRETGEFYTPEIWVNQSHDLLAKQLGEDWKNKYTVWDCACGTKNLTEGHEFSDLYSSTISVEDIVETDRDFVYDFLNGTNQDLEEIAPGLVDAFRQDKPILFYINPPYAAAGKRGVANDKTGMAATRTQALMKAEDWGGCTKQLYAQFFHRIQDIKKTFNLSNVQIGVFAPTIYLSAPSFKKFRARFFKEFSVESGFVFNASEFEMVNNDWGVAFIHLDGTIPNSKTSFPVSVKTRLGEEIIDQDPIVLYNLDSQQSAAKWVREELRGLDKVDLPQFSSALSWRDNNKLGVNNMIACANFDSNNVYKNNTDVFMVSSTSTRNSNVPIIEENWDKVISLYAARRSVSRTWLNWQDEYMAPNTSSPLWDQFVQDAIVFCMFDSKSNLSSVDVEYKGCTHDIRNALFFMSPEDVLSSIKSKGLEQIEKDLEGAKNPFFLDKLDESRLSSKAKSILDFSRQTFFKSVETRKSDDDAYNSLRLHRWDAGYAQLKKSWKQFHPEDFKRLREMFIDFSDQMKSRAYELGFLRS